VNEPTKPNLEEIQENDVISQANGKIWKDNNSSSPTYKKSGQTSKKSIGTIGSIYSLKRPIKIGDQIIKVGTIIDKEGIKKALSQMSGKTGAFGSRAKVRSSLDSG
jgi:hypothetical protein